MPFRPACCTCKTSSRNHVGRWSCLQYSEGRAKGTPTKSLPGPKNRLQIQLISLSGMAPRTDDEIDTTPTTFPITACRLLRTDRPTRSDCPISTQMPVSYNNTPLPSIRHGPIKGLWDLHHSDGLRCLQVSPLPGFFAFLWVLHEALEQLTEGLQHLTDQQRKLSVRNTFFVGTELFLAWSISWSNMQMERGTILDFDGSACFLDTCAKSWWSILMTLPAF